MWEGGLLLELEDAAGRGLVGEQLIGCLADQLIRVRQGRGNAELMIGQPGMGG